MTVEEFKYIYFWEYGHRMMGRLLGVAFVVPLGVFALQKKIPRSLYPRLFGLLSLGGAQVCVTVCFSVSVLAMLQSLHDAEDVVGCCFITQW